MTQKQAYYETVAASLAPLWEEDAQMSEADPDRWQKIRALDGWLRLHRADEIVSVGVYRGKCLELRTLYLTWRPDARATGGLP